MITGDFRILISRTWDDNEVKDSASPGFFSSSGSLIPPCGMIAVEKRMIILQNTYHPTLSSEPVSQMILKDDRQDDAGMNWAFVKSVLIVKLTQPHEPISGMIPGWYQQLTSIAQAGRMMLG